MKKLACLFIIMVMVAPFVSALAIDVLALDPDTRGPIIAQFIKEENPKGRGKAGWDKPLYPIIQKSPIATKLDGFNWHGYYEETYKDIYDLLAEYVFGKIGTTKAFISTAWFTADTYAEWLRDGEYSEPSLVVHIMTVIASIPK